MKAFKTFLLTLSVLALTSTAFGQTGFQRHTITLVDELGNRVKDVTSVEIYTAATTTAATIYNDRALNNTMTQPVTTGSTNTTLVNGQLSWYGPSGFDMTATSTAYGTVNWSGTFDNSTGRMVMPSYFVALSSLSTTDAQSLSLGTNADWVINAGTTPDLITFTPASDGAVFRIGLADGTKSGDFQVYTASGVGLLINEGADTFGITGLTTNINVSSNFATNINTGTSTGAVTIGSSTSGSVVVDTTSTLSLNSDGAMSLSTTDASANLSLDATVGSVVIDGGEAVDDAVVITATGAAGGIDITSLGDIDITTTGAAGEDITITNTGGSIILSATEADAGAIVIGTTAAGGDLNLDSVLGRIEIEAEEDVANAILIIADGGTSSTLELFNDTGTSATEGAASVQLVSDLGGIGLLSGLNAASAILLTVDAGTSETIRLHSDQGTGGASIELLSDAGGVTINAAAANGAGLVTINSILSLGTATALANDATPDISGSSFWETGGTTTITGFDVGSGSIDEGSLLIIKVLHTLVFDVTGTNLIGGSTDITAVTGDLLTWVYDGAAKWVLIAYMDLSDDLS